MTTVASIRVEIPLTPTQHEWLMSLVNRGIAADMDTYFEEGKFYAEIANPGHQSLCEPEPQIARPKD